MNDIASQILLSKISPSLTYKLPPVFLQLPTPFSSPASSISLYLYVHDRAPLPTCTTSTMLIVSFIFCHRLLLSHSYMSFVISQVVAFKLCSRILQAGSSLLVQTISQARCFKLNTQANLKCKIRQICKIRCLCFELNKHNLKMRRLCNRRTA